MITALIASTGLVLVALVGLLGQWLGNRNDRAIAHQEVDLLKKLDPDSRAARDLSRLIERRIHLWRWISTDPNRRRTLLGLRLLVFGGVLIVVGTVLRAIHDPSYRVRVGRTLWRALTIAGFASYALGFVTAVVFGFVVPSRISRKRRQARALEEATRKDEAASQEQQKASSGESPTVQGPPTPTT